MDPKIDVRFYDLLSHLWRGGQFAHWWAKTSTSKQSLWFATSQPADINLGWLRQMDFYYTVNPLGAHADRSVHHKSANEDVVAVNTLIAEFDDKDYAGNATGHAQTLTPPPSVIIHSGGGVHCYWLLDAPYLAPDRPARARIADIEKRWNAHIGGSVGVNDIARVLRIPGSLNFKYSPARPVIICEWHLDRLYRLADLEALLPPAPVAATAGPAVPNDMADQELLELARRAGNGAKFDRLWRGNLADYGGDHSSADLGLCALLSFWTGRDKARMDALFRQSGLMRDKWERQQYREDTLDKAIATTGECYTPGMGTDLDAIQAAMAAVGLTQKKAHTNGHSQGAATGPMQSAPVDQIVADIRNIATRTSDPAERMRLLRVELGAAIGNTPKSAIAEIKLALQTHLGVTATNATSIVKNFQADARAARQGPNSKTVTTDEYIQQLQTLGYTFRWNQCYESIEMNGRRMDDGLAAVIRSQMRDSGFPRIEAMEDAYVAEAYRNAYHPVKDYLNGLKWDGNNHIATLCNYVKDGHAPIQYRGNATASVFSVWLSRWLLGAVAKVFASGTVRGQNPVLVLDGAQALGKSTFALWLGSALPDMFIEEAIRPDDKECARWLASKWIWEVPELGSTTRRQDREALKSFITRHEVSFRKPYDRHPVTKPAMASFIGTINNEGGFLTDPTGNRRFLTVRLESIDWRYRDVVSIDQLWAQTYALYQQGASFALEPLEIATRDLLNGSYEVEDVYASRILDLYNVIPPPAAINYFVTTLELIEKLKLAGVREANERSMAMHIASACRHLKLESIYKMTNGIRQRGYLGLDPK